MYRLIIVIICTCISLLQVCIVHNVMYTCTCRCRQTVITRQSHACICQRRYLLFFSWASVSTECTCIIGILQVKEMFRGCRREDMPPHIFAAGQQAYHRMLQSNTDQSLILMGLSGSGKTFNARYLLQYLSTIGQIENGPVTCKLATITCCTCTCSFNTHLHVVLINTHNY